MIERYSLPEMKHIWSDEHKFDLWLQVEIAVCEAWCEAGRIPAEDMERIRNASCNLARMTEILQVTHHDVTAFLAAVAESLGPESRYVHLGLTSSDVMDTPLGLQLKAAGQILQRDVAGLIGVAIPRHRAQAHAIDGTHTRCSRRAYDLRAEAGFVGYRDGAQCRGSRGR